MDRVQKLKGKFELKGYDFQSIVGGFLPKVKVPIIHYPLIYNTEEQKEKAIIKAQSWLEAVDPIISHYETWIDYQQHKFD